MLFAALAAAVALAIGLGFDVLHFRNAVSVEWRTEHEDETLVVARTTEHDLRFPNDHRPLARYVQHWRVAEHGLPRSIPRLDAMVRARLFVRDPGGRAIAVRSDDHVDVSVDGARYEEATRLAQGWHWLEVHWTGTLRPTTSLELVWQGDDPIERSALFPAYGDWPETRRSFWLWVLVIAAAAAALAARAGVATTLELRRSRLLPLATLAVLVWGTGLRLWDYTVEPEFRDNYDEYFDMWNGWSLLEDGTTRAWSAWPATYAGSDAEMEHYPYWGIPLGVVSPYFENLPLMHLLAGAACHIGGTSDYRDCHHADGRLAAIGLSTLMMWLMIAIGRRVVPSGPGPWLGALLFGTLPPLVLQTRVVKEDLAVAALVLGLVYFFLRWRDDGRKRSDLAAASVIAGVALMAKLPAMMLIPALVMMVASTRDHRAALEALGMSLGAGLLVFVPFVAWQGFDVFLVATGGQFGSRGAHFLHFPRFFDLMMINSMSFGRGWAIFVWLAAVGGFYTWPPERRAAITVPLVVYMVAIGLAAGNYSYGWYALPIFALVVIPAGAFLGELWRAPDLLRGGLFGVLFVMYSVHFLAEPELFTDGTMTPFVRRLVMLVSVALVAPYCLVQVWPRFQPTARFAFAVALVVALYAQASLVVDWEELGPLHRTIEHTYSP